MGVRAERTGKGHSPSAPWPTTPLIALFPSHGAFGPGFGKSPRGKDEKGEKHNSKKIK